MIGKIAGETVSEAAKSAGEIADNLFTSDEERLKHEEAIKKLEGDSEQRQVDINKLDAQSKNKYQSGWRPTIGWVCGISLAMFYIPMYTLAAILWVKVCWQTQTIQPYPVSASSLMELVFVLLGWSGLRTYEKKKGING
jgi:hypothetical protein